MLTSLKYTSDKGRRYGPGVRKYASYGMRLGAFDMFDRVSNVGRNVHDGEVHISYNRTANERSRVGYTGRIDTSFAYFARLARENETSETRVRLNHRLSQPREQFVCIRLKR